MLSALRLARTTARLPSLARVACASRGYAVGDNLIHDDVALQRLDGTSVSTSELFENKTVVLFGVPGAFTPVCTSQHVPDFCEKAAEIKGKGVDTIACVYVSLAASCARAVAALTRALTYGDSSVNDRFVLNAWKDSITTATDDVDFLGDFDGTFVDQCNLSVDLSAAGLGKRAKRFAMIVDNGVVKHELVEESPANFEATTAKQILEHLSS